MPDLLDPLGALGSDRRLSPLSKPTHRVRLSVTNLKVHPDPCAQTVSQLLYGETVEILETSDDWVRIVSATDGYTGWVDYGALEKGITSATHIIHQPATHLYPHADLKAPPLQVLYAASPVTVVATQGRYSGLVGGGYVFSDHLSETCELEDDPLEVAASFLESPYLWGGRTAGGIDCSGLVQIALALCGMRVHRDSDLQFASIGFPATVARRGDLAFFPGHVGLMVDEENLLHANATHMAVTIDPLEAVVGWVAKETDKPPFSGFRRL